jgi:hypothetical protein
MDPGNADPFTYQPGMQQGNNYLYNIVQFVGVKLTYVDNNSVHVQPYPFISSSVVFTPNATPVGSSGNQVTTTFTFAPPKLTK